MANDGMDFLDELDFSESNSKDAVEKIAGFLPGPLGQYLAKGSPKQRKIKCAFLSTLCLVVLLVIILIGVTVIVVIASSSSSDDTTDTTTPPPPSDTTPPPPADATLPVIPKNFVTSYTSTIFFGEIPNVISGTYMEDGDGNNRKIDYVAWLPGAFPDYPLNNSQVVNSVATFQLSNDVCRIIPLNYSNPFDWLEDDDTYFAGYVTIDGVEYASWEADDFDVDSGSNYTIVLLVNGNIPYQLNQTFTSDFFNFTESLVFGSDFQETTFNGTEFDIPTVCYNEPICDPNPLGEIDELVFYRYHSAYDWQLENRNFGDLQGVATFLCWSYMFGYNTDPSLEVVSYYNVMVNTTWGEYGKCNLNYCAGSDDKTVGHAATGGFTANAGQCSTNEDIGNWYSLTTPTECSYGNTPDNGSCAWQLVEINQNITVECLLDSGFIDSCLGNPIVPFPDAAAVMQNAFATCPSVDANSFPPPSYTEEKSRNVVRSMMKEEKFPQKAVFSVAKELYSQLFGFY